jgi:hypothetical protein
MLDKTQIEQRLIDMFCHQQTLEENGEIEEVYFNGVENVRPFEGYLCTMDNGVVIDLADGTQICLTIQIR